MIWQENSPIPSVATFLAITPLVYHVLYWLLFIYLFWAMKDPWENRTVVSLAARIFSLMGALANTIFSVPFLVMNNIPVLVY